MHLACSAWPSGLPINTGATYGYLTEAANTVGAQWAKAQPQSGGLNAAQMLAGGLKAALLLNTEPVEDSAAGAKAVAALAAMQMVVTLSPFKTNMAFSDVLLPIAPFTETSGSFRQRRRSLAKFPCGGQAFGRNPSGLESVARLGQHARLAPIGF